MALNISFIDIRGDELGSGKREIVKSEERLRSDSVATPYTLKVAFNRPKFLFSSLKGARVGCSRIKL